MSMLLKDMSPEDMAQICSKALLSVFADGEGVSLEHDGHRYLVHRDGGSLIVSQADQVHPEASTILWDAKDDEPYLGV